MSGENIWVAIARKQLSEHAGAIPELNFQVSPLLFLSSVFSKNIFNSIKIFDCANKSAH